ncbi:MAG: hypothetical protein WCC77_08790 [Pseudolabrys sp.]
MSQAYTDWFQHLWFSPDKQIELIEKTAGLSYLVGACTGRSPPPD